MGRPCTCDRYPPGGRLVDGTHCVLCYLWHTHPDCAVVRRWRELPDRPGPPVRAGHPTKPPPPPAPAPVRDASAARLSTWRPCRHELPTVSWAACSCEGKHLRGCGVYDLCTRGEVRGSPYPACYRCLDYAPGDAA